MWAQGHLFYILLCALEYLNRLHKHIPEPMEDTDINPPEPRNTHFESFDEGEYRRVIQYIGQEKERSRDQHVRELFDWETRICAYARVEKKLHVFIEIKRDNIWIRLKRENNQAYGKNHVDIRVDVQQRKLYLYDCDTPSRQCPAKEIQRLDQGLQMIRDKFDPAPDSMRTEILTNFHNRILNLEERLAGGGVTLEG